MKKDKKIEKKYSNNLDINKKISIFALEIKKKETSIKNKGSCNLFQSSTF